MSPRIVQASAGTVKLGRKVTPAVEAGDVSIGLDAGYSSSRLWQCQRPQCSRERELDPRPRTTALAASPSFTATPSRRASHARPRSTCRR